MNLEARVLAIRLLDFHNDKNEHVHGYQVYCCASTDQADWTDNVELFKCWVPYADDRAAAVQLLHPGDTVHIGFSRRGKPVLILT